MKIQFIFKFSNRILIKLWKGIIICCLAGSLIFFVWDFDVPLVWCVWGLICLGFDVSGVVNGNIWIFFYIKTMFHLYSFSFTKRGKPTRTIGRFLDLFDELAGHNYFLRQFLIFWKKSFVVLSVLYPSWAKLSITIYH